MLNCFFEERKASTALIRTYEKFAKFPQIIIELYALLLIKENQFAKEEVLHEKVIHTVAFKKAIIKVSRKAEKEG